MGDSARDVVEHCVVLIVAYGNLSQNILDIKAHQFARKARDDVVLSSLVSSLIDNVR